MSQYVLEMTAGQMKKILSRAADNHMIVVRLVTLDGKILNDQLQVKSIEHIISYDEDDMIESDGCGVVFVNIVTEDELNEKFFKENDEKKTTNVFEGMNTA